MYWYGVGPRGVFERRPKLYTGEMGFESGMIVVMEAFDGRLLDGPVHPLDPSIGPGTLRLGRTMPNAVFAAAHVGHVAHVSRRRSAYRRGMGCRFRSARFGFRGEQPR